MRFPLQRGSFDHVLFFCKGVPKLTAGAIVSIRTKEKEPELSDIVETVNSSWGWTGVKAREVVGKNSFGNLLVVDFDGRYWRICPEELSCEIVSESSEAFSNLVETEDFQIDWEMARIVEIAQNKLGALPTGHVFYLVIPGIFGGAYDETNIRTVPLKKLISLAGYWAEEIKDLPDGAQIKLKVVE